jgi:hypothetical protein
MLLNESRSTPDASLLAVEDRQGAQSLHPAATNRNAPTLSTDAQAPESVPA